MQNRSKNDILRDRAFLFSEVRRFFRERDVLEVDCPIISRGASIDAHIDLIPVLCDFETCYLHSSPEYGMKRLIVEGIGDIYQLSHVFRLGEVGIRHNPEFTMAEWYRMGFSFEQMYEETLEFVRLFLGNLPSTIISYREAFQRYAGFDYLHASEKEIWDQLQKHQIATYKGIEEEGKDALLNLLVGTVIEPHLGVNNTLCVLIHYPASQAALAKTLWKGEEHVAERFEIYYNGIELANGYHELSDPQEQRKRFHESNELRLKLGKLTLPIDELFLKSLEKGLPDCSGVAVGFDRLMMLRHHTDLENVIPFPWKSI